MKNPFKKSSIIDTAINVGVGGAANVAMDYVFANVDALASLEPTTKNIVKIVAGAVGGSMVSNKYVRAAADGVATVGVSNLIASYMATDDTTNPNPENTSTTSGLPKGTIGRAYRMGQRGFRKVSGIAGEAGAFMAK
jgi:hypothetical protein